MNKNTVTSLCCLFFIISCSSYENKYKHYETKNYYISNSHIESNHYLCTNGDICEIPFLPSGLYINIENKNNVTIDYQNRIEDVDVYPIHNVIKLYENDDFIIVNTDVEFKKIDKNNPYIIENCNNANLEDFIIFFDTDSIDLGYSNSFIQNALSLQDKRINKQENVDFSTPVINGILKIGLYDKKFYFGQTLYSYFMLDLKTDEIKFFKDKEEYDDYCKKNISHSVEILEAAYLYN